MRIYESDFWKRRYSSVRFVRQILWEEIFDVWERNEALQEEWKKHWEGWGFTSWKEWRKHYAAPLDSENLQWEMFEVEDPFADAPEMFGVPSVGWIANVYRDTQTLSIREIVRRQSDGFDSRKNEKILGIRRNFPQETMLTGIVWEGKIVIVEGMHRVCALGMGRFEGGSCKPIVRLALAEWKSKSLPLLGGKPIR